MPTGNLQVLSRRIEIMYSAVVIRQRLRELSSSLFMQMSNL